MKNFKLWAALALVVLVVGGGLFAYWNFELRWRPTTVEKNQEEIAALLESAGWVSPGGEGRPLYMVAHRDCADCLRFMAEQFPDLQAAGVDTRVIMVARPDVNALSQSTPMERSTVAELWLSRDWDLLQRWRAVPAAQWDAPGIRPADGDPARSAVVEASRRFLAELEPLMAGNGVDLGYPLLVWWDEADQMTACVCQRRESYADLRQDFGLPAESDTPLVPDGEEDAGRMTALEEASEAAI